MGVTLKVFENKMLNRIVGHQRHRATRGWRIVLTEELELFSGYN
jgi:hypothetical protein